MILVSALGEDINRAALSAARKVFVDGFCGSTAAYELHVPRVPLSDLYGQRLEQWLADRQVALHVGSAVRQVAGATLKLNWAFAVTHSLHGV